MNLGTLIKILHFLFYLLFPQFLNMPIDGHTTTPTIMFDIINYPLKAF